MFPNRTNSNQASSQQREVKSTPEELKYIRTSGIQQYFIKPLATRCAWLGTLGLSALAIIPLAGKCVLNLVDGCFHTSSLKEAKKNALAILAVPAVSLLSGLSVIMPQIIGGRLGRAVAVPITLIYSRNKGFGAEKSSHAIYPMVRGVDGINIDSVDVLCEMPIQRYRIVFNASLEIYQVSFNKIMQENAQLKCHTRAFNYPGITRDDAPGSILDFINAGIAQVYDLAKKMNWTNDDLEKNLHLFGYCFGGGVALQVAAYFKEKHNVNLLIFVDRSFSSYSAAVAGVIHRYSGLPFIFSKILAATFLYGGGDLNLNSLAAVRKLNSQKIHYINLGHDAPAPISLSTADTLRKFLGLGNFSNCADSILFDGVALADGLDAEKITCGLGKKVVFDELTSVDDDHRVYELVKNEGHFVNLSSLMLNREKTVANRLNAREYYRKVVELLQTEGSSEAIDPITRRAMSNDQLLEDSAVYDPQAVLPFPCAQTMTQFGFFNESPDWGLEKKQENILMFSV